MTTHERPIRLRAPDGRTVDGVVKTEGSSTIWLWVIGPGVRSLGRGGDHFAALMDARRAIEAEGWRVLAYGASRNVWPSPMLSDMGSGLSAYRLRLGERPTVSDLVGVFDSGDDLDPVSVEEQTAFHRAWQESTGISG